MWNSDKQPQPAMCVEQQPPQPPPPLYHQYVPPQFQQQPQIQQQPQLQQQSQFQQQPQFQPQAQPQVVVYNIPSSSIPTYPAVQSVQQSQGWMKRNHKNKPQSNSVGTGSLIFISGGMNMAWKLGLGLKPNLHFVITDHIVLSWFIGGIIGAIIGAFICNRLPKKFGFCFSSILVMISGMLQVIDSRSYDAILVSRYINGIAVGLIFPLTFVMVGEECVKEIRGTNAASIDVMSFSGGIFIQVVYSFSWTIDMEASFPTLQVCGILSILWGVMALIFASILIIESPILYLARGEEQLAIDALRRLQRPYTITYETYQQLDEHKRYVAENNEHTFLENAIYGLPALLKLCFYRSFIALGFSYFVNYAFTYSANITSRSDIWPYMLYAFARWLGPFMTMFTLDHKGRKQPMITGFIVCTALAFTVGGIFDDQTDFLSSYYMDVVKFLLIFYQLFASVAITPSSVYISEAFPLDVKPYFISIVFIVEMLVQIIIISCNENNFLNIFNVSDYFVALGALSLAFFTVAILIMPETKGLTLRECLVKFKKFINLY